MGDNNVDQERIENNISKRIEEREEIRLNKFSGSLKVIYTVFSVGAVISAGLFSYLNLLMVNKDEFVSYKESTSKETIALVEKEGSKLSNQVKETLYPVVSQVSDIKDRFYEAMDSFSIKLHEVERRVDLNSNVIEGATLVRSESLHSFERDMSGILQELKLKLLSIESNILQLDGKDQLLIQKIDSLEIELSSLIRDLDRRVIEIEKKSQ